jgi:dienelactone hydrolase
MISRQPFWSVLLFSLLLTPGMLGAEDDVPSDVKSLWADFDPRQVPLDTRQVRQWEKDNITYRYVTYRIGTFKGQQARMAAFFAFPTGATRLPGLLHLHGGGQRAFQHEVEYYAKRGYACLSINWGGREMEDALPDDLNTDWGAVDPTQKNVPGYSNLKPGELYLDPSESPRNNNWYLLTLGSRRGLTFLEQQPEVDADRLGVYGHSMGGNLTMYVAGTDKRVKAAAPSVGGQGFRTMPLTLLPEQRPRRVNGNVELFRATIGFQSYAPLVKAPLLWLSATNDFHQYMDDTFRTADLMPGVVRFSFAPHLNHRFTPPFAVTRPLWMDQYLKGTFKFPETPVSTLVLDGKDGIPRLEVRPDMARPIDHVHILYSVDPDPQARFWRTARAISQRGNKWSAPLPILSTDRPLFACANVHYKLDKPEEVPFARPTSSFALTSQLHTATPENLQEAEVKATDKPSGLIDDFSSDWQDWYRLSADNPHHWQYWTRKISDPKWRGATGNKLALEVRSAESNELVVMLTENFFRSYRGRQQEYLALVPLAGGDDWQSITLSPSDFTTPDKQQPLESWQQVDLLGLRAFYQQRGSEKIFGSNRWKGPQPRFRNMRWEGDND